MFRVIDGTRTLTPARPWLAPLGLFVGSLAFYAINLDHPPRFDELYHVLGARGYLEHGEPRIAEGVYTRAALFTVVVAFLFDIFGESIAVARLPAVACGALIGLVGMGVGLVFLMLANTASVRTVTMLVGITMPPQIPAADWAGVAARRPRRRRHRGRHRRAHRAPRPAAALQDHGLRLAARGAA